MCLNTVTPTKSWVLCFLNEVLVFKSFLHDTRVTQSIWKRNCGAFVDYLFILFWAVLCSSLGGHVECQVEHSLQTHHVCKHPSSALTHCALRHSVKHGQKQHTGSNCACEKRKGRYLCTWCLQTLQYWKINDAIGYDSLLIDSLVCGTLLIRHPSVLTWLYLKLTLYFPNNVLVSD